MPDPTVLRIDVNNALNNSLTFRFSSGRSRTVNFYTSGGDPVVVTFTGAPPFTDTTNPFTISNATGEDKTIPSSATGNHQFTAGDRTGDIDITVQV